MSNSKLNLLEKLQWLDWGTLYIGAKGLPDVTVDPADISDYACSQINEVDEANDVFISIAELAYCDAISDETLKHLERLAEWDNIDIHLSVRKWRLVAFMKILNDLNDDYIYALLDLNSFWNQWEGSDTPDVVQGVGNNMNPSEFYSLDNFKEVMLKNKKWIDDEINAINIAIKQT